MERPTYQQIKDRLSRQEGFQDAIDRVQEQAEFLLGQVESLIDEGLSRGYGEEEVEINLVFPPEINDHPTLEASCLVMVLILSNYGLRHREKHKYELEITSR